MWNGMLMTAIPCTSNPNRLKSSPAFVPNKLSWIVAIGEVQCLKAAQCTLHGAAMPATPRVAGSIAG